jgi:hypothetical protein
VQKISGIDEFKRVLREFKNLSLWAGASSLIIPFVASFLSIIPPWPSGLNVITSVAQLVTLIVVYQAFSGSRTRITRNIKTLAFICAGLLLAYMAIFTTFTIYVPQAHRSIVIGYECSPSAQKLFADRCPFLTVDDLATAAYDEFLLWTRISITTTRILLVSLWLSLFICLAMLIGQFLIFQLRRKINSA